MEPIVGLNAMDVEVRRIKSAAAKLNRMGNNFRPQPETPFEFSPV